VHGANAGVGEVMADFTRDTVSRGEDRQTNNRTRSTIHFDAGLHPFVDETSGSRGFAARLSPALARLGRSARPTLEEVAAMGDHVMSCDYNFIALFNGAVVTGGDVAVTALAAKTAHVTDGGSPHSVEIGDNCEIDHRASWPALAHRLNWASPRPCWCRGTDGASTVAFSAAAPPVDLILSSSAISWTSSKSCNGCSTARNLCPTYGDTALITPVPKILAVHPPSSGTGRVRNRPCSTSWT